MAVVTPQRQNTKIETGHNRNRNDDTFNPVNFNVQLKLKNDMRAWVWHHQASRKSNQQFTINGEALDDQQQYILTKSHFWQKWTQINYHASATGLAYFTVLKLTDDSYFFNTIETPYQVVKVGDRIALADFLYQSIKLNNVVNYWIWIRYTNDGQTKTLTYYCSTAAGNNMSAVITPDNYAYAAIMSSLQLPADPLTIDYIPFFELQNNALAKPDTWLIENDLNAFVDAFASRKRDLDLGGAHLVVKRVAGIGGNKKSAEQEYNAWRDSIIFYLDSNQQLPFPITGNNSNISNILLAYKFAINEILRKSFLYQINTGGKSAQVSTTEIEASVDYVVEYFKTAMINRKVFLTELFTALATLMPELALSATDPIIIDFFHDDLKNEDGAKPMPPMLPPQPTDGDPVDEESGDESDGDAQE